MGDSEKTAYEKQNLFDGIGKTAYVKNNNYWVIVKNRLRNEQHILGESEKKPRKQPNF